MTVKRDSEGNPTITVAGSLLTRVPGRARPRNEVLEEFEAGVADLRSRMKPALWPLLIAKAEDMFRWRVMLECGCVDEVLTLGQDRYPDQGSSTDPLSGYRLPVGQYWCRSDHETPKPFRDIVEWVRRKVREFPPDPEEPQHGLDPETWAKIRHPEPHSSAFWTVRLSCGHFTDSVVTDVEWKPEVGPKFVTKKRLAEMRHDFNEHWASGEAPQWPEEGPRRHFRKMLDLGWPRPARARGRLFCLHRSQVGCRLSADWLARPAAEAAIACTHGAPAHGEAASESRGRGSAATPQAGGSPAALAFT